MKNFAAICRTLSNKLMHATLIFALTLPQAVLPAAAQKRSAAASKKAAPPKAPAKMAAKTAPRSPATPAAPAAAGKSPNAAAGAKKTLLAIKTNVPSATVSIDGIAYGKANAPLEIEPGTVELDLTAPGFKTRRIRTQITANTVNTVTINLESNKPPPTPTPKPQPKQKPKAELAKKKKSKSKGASDLFLPDPGTVPNDSGGAFDPSIQPPGAAPNPGFALQQTPPSSAGAAPGYSQPPPAYAQPPVYAAPPPVYMAPPVYAQPQPYYGAPSPYGGYGGSPYGASPYGPPAYGPPAPDLYGPPPSLPPDAAAGAAAPAPAQAQPPPSSPGGSGPLAPPPAVGKSNRSSKGGSKNLFLAVLPFGVGQFQNKSYIKGTIVLGGQLASLYFYKVNSDAAAQAAADTNTKRAERDQTSETIGDSASRAQYDAETAKLVQEGKQYVEDTEKNATYSLYAFAGLYAAGVVDALIDDPPKPKKGGGKTKRRRSGFSLHLLPTEDLNQQTWLAGLDISAISAPEDAVLSAGLLWQPQSFEQHKALKPGVGLQLVLPL